jgi:hypothetical protein
MNAHQNDDETLASCSKQSTQQRGKEEQREMTQVQARSSKTPKWLHQMHMPHTTEKGGKKKQSKPTALPCSSDL